MTTITLSRPIEAHGETLTTLTLREPTGADIIACGYPIDAEGQLHAGHIAALAARCGGVPPSTLASLSARDVMAVTTAILGFFGASAAPTS